MSRKGRNNLFCLLQFRCETSCRIEQGQDKFSVTLNEALCFLGSTNTDGFFSTLFAFYSLHTRFDRTHMDKADLAGEVCP